jgi:FkbM family methyltransferase
MRHRFHPLIWSLLRPVRWFVSQPYWLRGKGLLLRKVLIPTLPPAPADFVSSLPGDVDVLLRYRESLGLTTMLHGGFETAELNLARSLVRPGSIAIDVGANVGIWTTCLARASEPDGCVWAFEPLTANLHRLHQHLALNRLNNVEVHPIALGPAGGMLELLVPDDLAFASAVATSPKRPVVSSSVVRMDVLDDIWRLAGSPEVSVMKIDVEGGELGVLQGARALLSYCHPTLFVEAPTNDQLATIYSYLRRLGYRHNQPAGFLSWNHLFDSQDPR